MNTKTLAVLMSLLTAAGYSGASVAQVYKCVEDGKAVYQDGPCAAGASKAVDTRGPAGFEAPKGRPAAETQAPAAAPPAAQAPARPSATSRARCVSSYSKCN